MKKKTQLTSTYCMLVATLYFNGLSILHFLYRSASGLNMHTSFKHAHIASGLSVHTSL